MPVAVSLTIASHPSTMEADGTLQLTASILFDDASIGNATYTATWASSDTTVAHANSGVTNGGLIVSAGAGTVTITATYQSVDFAPTPVSDTTTLTVTAIPPLPPDPEGRFLLAFDQPTLEPYPTWTRIDEVYPNLVTSYSIDRGRQYELDRFDAGRAQVEIADPDGTLYPGNPEGPFYGGPGPYGPLIKPLLQAAIGRRNPVTGEWKLRYRGFVESFSFRFDPGAALNWMTISLIDLFAMLAAVEMEPGQYGTPAPPAADGDGQIYFPEHKVEERIAAALVPSGISKRFQVLFPGNVLLHTVVYSAGESPLTVVQDAADGEFPGANVFCDRRGRICFHDRFARFYPAESAAAAGADRWDYHAWKAGDGAAVTASPSDTVQLREFAFDRGLSRLINSASATSKTTADTEVAGQLVTEPESVAYFGIRSWSTSNLLTNISLIDGNGPNAETRLFAWYIVANFKWLRDRITAITFRSLHPDDPRAAACWEFLTTVDIGDTVSITVASPTGTGGYVDYVNIVEGIHEHAEPLTPDYDNVTLTLDLSPMADYETNPWPAPEGLIASRGSG